VAPNRDTGTHFSTVFLYLIDPFYRDFLRRFQRMVFVVGTVIEGVGIDGFSVISDGSRILGRLEAEFFDS